MLYPVLAFIFFATLVLTVALLFSPRRKFLIFMCVWYAAYAVFIVFFTGTDVAREPARYKLPWKGGVRRFVAQGNNSFTSHHGVHLYAWDFVMPNGTEVLAARDGIVRHVEDQHDGIGFKSNFISIEHQDGQQSAYAHIRKNSSLVKVGDEVKRAQAIALSGMVGQTLFPHLHFWVMNKEGTEPIPVSFEEIQDAPKAGHFYTSGNL